MRQLTDVAGVRHDWVVKQSSPTCPTVLKLLGSSSCSLSGSIELMISSVAVLLSQSWVKGAASRRTYDMSSSRIRASTCMG